MGHLSTVKLAGILFAFSSVFLLASGCGNVVRGSGVIVTETFAFNDGSVDSYNSLRVCCGFRVNLWEGDEASVTITADDNIIDALTVRDLIGEIDVDRDDGDAELRPSQPVEVDVVLNNVRSIEAVGGVDLTVAPIDLEKVTVGFYGETTADFQGIRADEFDLEFDGKGRVTVRGMVDRQTVTLEAGASYRAEEMESTGAEMTLRGGSEARVRVTDTLTVTATEGSRVRYLGEPTVQSHLRGGSGVQPID